jgi:diguanylate cyclase (GGDEF)-like protein/PAS domain S-box-containing protein
MPEPTSALPLSAGQVIDNILEAVMVTDANAQIVSVNAAFTRVTGYTPEEVVGKTPRMLKSGEHKPVFYTKMWATLAKNGSWQGEITNRHKSGEPYLEWLTISAIKDEQNVITHYLAVFNDISKHKRAQETIRHMAYYDALTDLPNRALFRDELRAALVNAERQNTMIGVLFLDLDRVKVINDTLGHDMGDRLLRGVAERLKRVIRPGDLVARLGGDEFMVLLTAVDQKSEILSITEKILTSIRPPFLFEHHELFTTASIGISAFPHDGRDAETLLKNADAAMYRAKRRGRNNYQVFDPTMKVEVFQQLALDNGLRRALERNEFIVHYQPQIDLLTGHIVGMEALVRWQHPELGLIPPSTFIQWAEDSGLIIPIGERVLRMACEQNKQWMENGHHHLKVGVNVSAKQMRESNIIETVSKVLKETGLPPDCLELELTESVIMDLSGQAMTVPLELKAMGVGFSIDDFGTGYSSLNYLKRLPVNTLKMDQSFVRDLTVDSNDAAIATAVIGLGHGLNLNVLAEGVETQGQIDYLRGLKCDQVQGFVVSEPVPPNTFAKLLDQQNHLDRDTLFHQQ